MRRWLGGFDQSLGGGLGLGIADQVLEFVLWHIGQQLIPTGLIPRDPHLRKCFWLIVKCRVVSLSLRDELNR